MYGQFGCYQFLFELSPVSPDLQLAAICCEHNQDRFPYEGYYLLLHHPLNYFLKNVKASLQSSKLRAEFEFIERFKVVLEGCEPQYFVALKINHSEKRDTEEVRQKIEDRINEVAILMRRTITFSEADFSFHHQVCETLSELKNHPTVKLDDSKEQVAPVQEAQSKNIPLYKRLTEGIEKVSSEDSSNHALK